MKTEINYLTKETTPTTGDMLKTALSLVAGTDVIVKGNRDAYSRVIKLVANIRHNEYASSIDLIGIDGCVEAYFLNGQFWTSITKKRVSFK
jgi:hypothetical protein